MASSRLFNDGDEEYLEIDSNLGIANPPFSVAVWFKSDDLTVTQTLFCLADLSEEAHTHRLLARGSEAGDPIQAYTQGGGAAYSAATSSGYSANTWHLAVGVWTSATLRAAYLDGGNKGTDEHEMTPTGLDRASIGRAGDFTPTSYMSGNMALVTVWDAVLGDDDVVALWNSGSGVDPTTIHNGDLVANWHTGAENDEDQTAAYDLTAYNTPTWDSGDFPVVMGGNAPTGNIFGPMGGPLRGVL